MVRRLRYRVASFATSAEGEASWGVGGRIGYWPCVSGPFIQLGLGTRRISIWYGTEYIDPAPKPDMSRVDHKHVGGRATMYNFEERTITFNATPPRDPRFGDLWNDHGEWYEWSGAWRRFDIGTLRVP